MIGRLRVDWAKGQTIIYWPFEKATTGGFHGGRPNRREAPARHVHDGPGAADPFPKRLHFFNPDRLRGAGCELCHRDISSASVDAVLS